MADSIGYYDYIEKFPGYIHSSPLNLYNTAKKLKEEYKPQEERMKNLTALWINDIINFQKQREDKIIKEIKGNNIKSDNLTEIFERSGLIASKGLQQKLINELEKMRTEENGERTIFYQGILDLRKKINKDKKIIRENVEKIEKARNQKNNIDTTKMLTKINYENSKEEIEQIFSQFRNKLEKVKQSLSEIEAENNIDSKTVDKINDILNFTAEGNGNDYYEAIYNYFNGFYGILSNWFSNIMEMKILEEENEIISTVYLQDEADKFRKNKSGVMQRAKSDSFIIKEGFDIPIGGISAKKAAKRIKFHTTSGITNYLNTIKKYGGYIDNNEMNRDIIILEYLMGNLFFRNRNDNADFLNPVLDLITNKYSYVFVANGVFKEILYNYTLDKNFDNLNDIFNYEHADFIFLISPNGTIVKRVSDEIQEIISKKLLKTGVNISSKYPNARSKSSEILQKIHNIKRKEIIPFSYSEALKNSLLIGEMKTLKESIEGKLEITVNL